MPSDLNDFMNIEPILHKKTFQELSTDELYELLRVLYLDINPQKLYDYEKSVFLPYDNDGCADPFCTECI